MALADVPNIGPTDTAAPPPKLHFDPGFLNASDFDHYVAFASAGDGLDPRFNVFKGPVDCSQSPYPLPLCEFLAYKSVLAYEPDKTIEANINGHCRGAVPGSYRFFDSSRERGDTQGFGFVIGDTAYIVMRGTTSLSDWIDDVAARLTDSKWISKKSLAAIGEPLPPRHLGFARAWANVTPQVETWLADLKDKNIAVRHYCFSGHSLGGALAIIGAHDFARKQRDVAAVVTFAAPKVGGKAFADHYNTELNLGPRTIRLESPEDAVTWLALSRDYTTVGHRWVADRRPMLKGMEKFGAMMFGIAGWQASDPGSVDFGGSSSSSTDSASKSGPSGPTGTQSTPSAQGDGKNGLIWIGVVVLGIVLYMVTRKLIIRYRAHGVSKRYTLYLTTLAYQQIRARRGEDYDQAIKDLEAHLKFIRGTDEGPYKSLRGRPIRVTKDNAKKLLEQTLEKGPYAGYFY